MANLLISTNRFPPALEKYLEAFNAAPHEPLVSLCISTLLLRVAMHRKVSRHAEVNIRMETADPLQESRTHSMNAHLAPCRRPFIDSVLGVSNPSSVFLTPP